MYLLVVPFYARYAKISGNYLKMRGFPFRDSGILNNMIQTFYNYAVKNLHPTDIMRFLGEAKFQYDKAK